MSGDATLSGSPFLARHPEILEELEDAQLEAVVGCWFARETPSCCCAPPTIRERLPERRDRLGKFIAMDAPESVVADECWLYLGSYYGGDALVLLRAAWRLAKRYLSPLGFLWGDLLCKVGLHARTEPGAACWRCEGWDGEGDDPC